MSQKFIQTPPVALYSGMSAAATSCVIAPYPLDIQTQRKLTMADWGTIGYATVDPKVYGYEEIISFTGITDNGNNTATLTGLTRNLIGEDPYTTAGTGRQHGSSAVVVFSNNPQLYASLASLANSNTFTGLNIFNTYAPQTSVAPVAGNDIPNLTYVQALVLGTLTTINVIVPGTAGVTVVAGNSLYYDDPTNQWKKTDATSASTVDGVLLGIAQGAGTAGNSITGGVLLQGVDSNQTGLTDGQTMYASNTPGAISSSAGTISVVLGISKGTTQLYFAPRFNQQITANQLAALAGGGSLGTPSSANKFETQAGLQSGSELYIADASGSSTAYTAAFSPAITVYTDGMEIRVKIINANTTTTPTLSVNGLTARTIVKTAGTALAVGDIGANMYCSFEYDLANTRWILKSPVANAPLTASYQEYVFTANGTFVAPRGVTSVLVDIVAGGGGGGRQNSNASGAGGGGGGGAGALNVTSSVTAFASYAVVVGAAGTAGTNNGGAGGTSSFNGISKTGGNGGTGGAAGGGGSAGDASAGAGGAGTASNSGTGGNGTAGTSGGTPGNGAVSNAGASSGGGGGGGASGIATTGGNGGTRSAPAIDGIFGAGGGGGDFSAAAGAGGAGIVIIKVPLSQII